MVVFKNQWIGNVILPYITHRIPYTLYRITIKLFVSFTWKALTQIRNFICFFFLSWLLPQLWYLTFIMHHVFRCCMQNKFKLTLIETFYCVKPANLDIMLRVVYHCLNQFFKKPKMIDFDYILFQNRFFFLFIYH